MWRDLPAKLSRARPDSAPQHDPLVSPAWRGGPDRNLAPRGNRTPQTAAARTQPVRTQRVGKPHRTRRLIFAILRMAPPLLNMSRWKLAFAKLHWSPTLR